MLSPERHLALVKEQSVRFNGDLAAQTAWLCGEELVRRTELSPLSRAGIGAAVTLAGLTASTLLPNIAYAESSGQPLRNSLKHDSTASVSDIRLQLMTFAQDEKNSPHTVVPSSSSLVPNIATEDKATPDQSGSESNKLKVSVLPNIESKEVKVKEAKETEAPLPVIPDVQEWPATKSSEISPVNIPSPMPAPEAPISQPTNSDDGNRKQIPSIPVEIPFSPELNDTPKENGQANVKPYKDAPVAGPAEHEIEESPTPVLPKIPNDNNMPAPQPSPSVIDRIGDKIENITGIGIFSPKDEVPKISDATSVNPKTIASLMTEQVFDRVNDFATPIIEISTAIGVHNADDTVVADKHDRPEYVVLESGAKIKEKLNSKYGKSGMLSKDELAPLSPHHGGHRAQKDAAQAFQFLDEAWADDHDGDHVDITDSYRDYPAQEDVYSRKPKLAAVPGRSNHGWGMAIDFADGISSFESPGYRWMKENAPKYGWEHPSWAEPGGSRPEPWHWEYTGGKVKTEYPDDGDNKTAAVPGESIIAKIGLRPLDVGAVAGFTTVLAGTEDIVDIGQSSDKVSPNIDETAIKDIPGPGNTPTPNPKTAEDNSRVPGTKNTPATPVARPIDITETIAVPLVDRPIVIGAGEDIAQPDDTTIPDEAKNLDDKNSEEDKADKKDARVEAPKGIKGDVTLKVVSAMLPNAKDINACYSRIMGALIEADASDTEMSLYMFATEQAEVPSCEPIPEIGKGNGRYKTDSGNFYGRGDIQLTHEVNYKAAGEALDLPLIEHPDLALEPKNAARIAAWFITSNGREERIRNALKDGNLGLARSVVNGGNGSPKSDSNPRGSNGIPEFVKSYRAGQEMISGVRKA